MNSIVSCYSCQDYDTDRILPLLEVIYSQTQGPVLAGKTVLVKPNILTDDDPAKAVTTHPVFLEAVIRFLQNRRVEKIFVGDSPAIHSTSFKPRKSGIFDVCEKTGAEWVCFGKETVSLSLPSGKTPVTGIVHKVDYIISLPKLKTHELMGYTGAIKNTFGIIPHLHKTKQHAFHHSSESMASFLVDLNESITPGFIFMDAITAMEGPGPGSGNPYPLHLILGSTNLLAIDIIATKIIGYDPLSIDTNSEALRRGKWLASVDEIVVKGDPIEQFIRNDFKLIQRISIWKMSRNIISKRIPGLRGTVRRPVFNKKKCTGCQSCVKICSVQALQIFPDNPKKVIFDSKKCIHCFCCHEVCQYNAIEIRN